jgi:hypothetical protein
VASLAALCLAMTRISGRRWVDNEGLGEVRDLMVRNASGQGSRIRPFAESFTMRPLGRAWRQTRTSAAPDVLASPVSGARPGNGAALGTQYVVESHVQLGRFGVRHDGPQGREEVLSPPAVGTRL